MASKAIAPIEQKEEDAALNEVKDEIQEEHKKDVGFDVAVNITAEVYQQT
jgi:hypothetical protein